jgi:hypothetical protein
MIKFAQYLEEGIRIKQFEAAVAQIVSYMEKHIGKMYAYPEMEHFKNSVSQGVGLRYFFEDGRSVRFNWTKSSASAKLDSISLWQGTTKHPNFQLHGIDGTPLGNISLAKILPTLVATIKSPKVGQIDVSTAEHAEVLIGELTALVEAVLTEDPYEDVISQLQMGPVSRHNISKMGRNQERIFNDLLAKYKNAFDIKTDAAGRQRFTLIGSVEDFDKDDVVKTVVGGAAKRGRTAFEVVSVGGEECGTDGEAEAERKYPSAPKRIPYEEQIEDMKTIITAVVKGASNFCIIGGKGGLGKTHTVEETLSELGLEDGNGYFKNTSSGSPPGLYRTLFINKTGIVVLDDSDMIVNTQEGRNLLKAALDTKKRRKLVWGKMSSWLFDPADDYEMEKANQAIEAGEEPEKFPRYFDYEGRVIMISNLPLETLDPDGALATRGFVIALDPTDEEIVSFMRKIAPNIKVEGGNLSEEERLAVVDLLEKQGGALNIRKLVRGLNLAASGVPNYARLIERYC